MFERKLSDIENLHLAIEDAELEFIYGRIGQGKTVTGTVLSFAYLKQGCPVKTSYPIKFEGYDQNKIWYFKVLKFLGLKQDFLVVPKENYYYFNFFTGEGIYPEWKHKWKYLTEDERRNIFYSWLSKQTDCVIVIDEAQFPFDSYFGTKMDIDHRMTILATRHFNRLLVCVAQRPTSVHTVFRSQVARFWKLEKTFKGWWFIPAHFQMTEFQDTDANNSVPKEDRVLKFDEETKQMLETDEYKYAIRQRKFWLKKKIAQSYDSKYLRAGMPASQENFAKIVHYSGVWDTIQSLFRWNRTAGRAVKINKNEP